MQRFKQAWLAVPVRGPVGAGRMRECALPAQRSTAASIRELRLYIFGQ